MTLITGTETCVRSFGIATEETVLHATTITFAFSRVSRLYPAYWTALTLMVLVRQGVFGKPVWVGDYVVNLTMLQEFVGFGNLD